MGVVTPTTLIPSVCPLWDRLAVREALQAPAIKHDLGAVMTVKSDPTDGGSRLPNRLQLPLYRGAVCSPPSGSPSAYREPQSRQTQGRRWGAVLLIPGARSAASFYRGLGDK
ncbi:hypothetical protein D1872_231030 [compost metagenome]